MDIRELNPRDVWGHFADICSIPHPSKHEEAILVHLKKFADDHGLSYSQDETGNLVIRKTASKGHESSPTVILQAHVDMVPQKNLDVAFDFEIDAIRPYIDGEWVTAQDTTLGADNGIGCATMLAILSNKTLEHPALEALFTVDEETGLTGANGLDPKLLTGSIMINLDSEDEGELYVGCAGAVNNTGTVPYSCESMPSAMQAYVLDLRGLKGGHSGLEVILQRGNANKILVRFLREQAAVCGLRLASLDGGSLRNAIPREARSTVVVPVASAAAFQAAVVKFEEQITYEYRLVESAIKFTASACDTPAEIICTADQKRLLDALTVIPNGILRMSDAMPGLVETSTNMSRISTDGKALTVLFMTRCMVNYGKRELSAMIRSVFELAGGSVIEENDYDGWAPDMNSRILATMKAGYESLYGRTPEVKAIHAGLECGILGAKYPKGLDMISIGPTMRFPHSPDEKVNIATVAKFYDFLLYTLKQL